MEISYFKSWTICVILMTLFFYSCSTSNKIKGEWRVIDINIEVNDSFMYIQEIEPGLIETNLSRQFPVVLKKGDIIRFSPKKNLITVGPDTFYCKIDDKEINVRRLDVTYHLDYRINNKRLILERELSKGKIEWLFEKSK